MKGKGDEKQENQQNTDERSGLFGSNKSVPNPHSMKGDT